MAMMGNRTRSPVALARHQSAATAQAVAAANVRASSDAAIVEENVVGINDAISAQQDQIHDLGVRVGDLEDIP
ncbi:hypothetical protein ACKU27_11145 [Sphingobium yanoikuyae]|uniref:hypothetical protein n=1 Tax=Sphingobium yanoikuyae TaxID=13690 RepID=UPI003B9021C5